MQDQLFHLIKANYKHKEKLIADLMELLNISRSATYKRLSGTILLNAVEITNLIQHYQIDSHLLFGKKKGNLVFQFPPLFEQIENQGDFLTPIIAELQQLSTLPDTKINFLATGFPIFYFFFHKEMAHFKFYIFKNSVWDKPKTKLRKFILSEVDHDYDRLANYEKIRELYAMIDSEEVWSGNIFQSTIEDIKSYLEAGLFETPNDALILIDKLLETINQIDQMVQDGNKTLMSGKNKSAGQLTVYYNNFGRFASNILTSSSAGSKVYSTYDLPNYLICEDKDFISYTENWMKKIKNKSNPVSTSSDLDRLKFFNRLRDAIKADKVILEEMISKL